MEKEREIRKIVKEMKVGDLIRFPTGKDDEYIEVERIFFKRSPAWAVYCSGERQIFQDMTKVIQIVSKNWNQDLKKVMEDRYTDLLEIIDLGEY